MSSFKFCPHCGNGLQSGLIEGRELMICSASCGFVHYNNPTPVVAIRIKMIGGHVLVKRGVAPAKGKWCMPCGYVDEEESLQDAAIREALQETHLIVTVPELPFKIVNLGFVNQHLFFFEGTVVGGTLAPGSDAEEAACFAPNALPEMAFSSHTEVLLAA